jgi:lipid A 4'-phosphatase
MVNTLFKDQWGRARPSQTTLFGGSQPFTPAWEVSHACERNCSFVSGHASMGFYLYSFAFLTTGRRRQQWIAGGTLAGLGLGLLRIAQGGHFLSDVLLSGCVVVYAAAFSYGLVMGGKK